jgi:hypothetical protein
MEWRELAQGVLYAVSAARVGHRFSSLRLCCGWPMDASLFTTAPFTAEDVAAIHRRFGTVLWSRRAADARNFAEELAPRSLTFRICLAGFAKLTGPPRRSPAAAPTGPVSRGAQDRGLRKINEHAFFHLASRTLVLADLLFHFPADSRGWSRFFTQRIMRLPRLLGISAFFRLMIRDQKAFALSMETMSHWDFQQIVVGHGEPIQNDAKMIFAQALRDRALVIDG